jgi:hypothetical protein
MTQPEANMEATEQELLPNRINKTIPLSKMIEYRKKGLTYQEIGDLLGCSKVNVWERLQPFSYEIDNLNNYKDERADTLALYQQVMLSGITEDKVKKAHISHLTTAFGILYDKERLERGLSTDNQARMSISLNIGTSKQDDSKRSDSEIYKSKDNSEISQPEVSESVTE